jgi:membrane protein DedA with SNARE-associated domain
VRDHTIVPGARLPDDRVVAWWLVVIVVFVAPLVDSIVPVIPGEVIVAGAATPLAGASLPTPGIIAAAAAGSLAGECIVVAIAHRLAATPRGDRIAAASRARRVRRWLDRWGVGTVVVARFLPGGRTVAAATYGLRAGPSKGFVAAAAVGALAWASYLVLVGTGIGLFT